MGKSIGRYVVRILAVAGFALFVVVLESSVHAEWREYWFGIFEQAAEYFLPAVGTTPLGFHSTWVVPILILVVGIVVVLTQRGRDALRSHWDEAKLGFKVVMIAFFLYYGPILGWCFVKAIYIEHSENLQLKKTNNGMSAELEWRKNNLSTNDPIFVNIIYLLQDFQIYRAVRHGEPCVIYITATPDTLALASAVAQFSNSVSECSTFGPMPVGNPDTDDMTMDGMVPRVVVVHTQRDDKAALELQERLGNQIQTRLSYKPPKIPKDHLYAGSRYNYTERFVWLQFGTGVKWNSEMFARPK
jgi:hypothetical protein